VKSVESVAGLFQAREYWAEPGIGSWTETPYEGRNARFVCRQLDGCDGVFLCAQGGTDKPYKTVRAAAQAAAMVIRSKSTRATIARMSPPGEPATSRSEVSAQAGLT